MEYLTTQKTAEKRELSMRTMWQLCAIWRIFGAERFGRSWAIPDTAEKPTDPRKEKKGGGGHDR